MRHDVEQVWCRACGWTGDHHLAELGCPVCGADTIEPGTDPNN